MKRNWILTRIGVLLSLVLLLAVVAACSSDGDDNGAAAVPATSVAAAPAPTVAAPVGPPKVDRLIIGIAPFSQESTFDESWVKLMRWSFRDID